MSQKQRSSVTALAVALSLTANSCGIDDTSGGGPGDIATAFVDATTGDDSAIGIEGRLDEQIPFKSITRALTCITSEVCEYAEADRNSVSEIRVAPGVYDEANGEVFPLIIPAGLIVSGERTVVVDGEPLAVTKETAATINGTGVSDTLTTGGIGVAVALDESAQIRHFAVEATGGIAVWSQSSSGSQIARTIVQNSLFGIGLSGEGSATVAENVIRNNSTGMELLGSVSPSVFGNRFSSNDVGVHVRQNAKPNLGDGLVIGNNTIAGNTLCDLHQSSDESISAIGNTWDEDVFQFTESIDCSAGANLVDDGLGSVDYRYVPSQDVLLFPGSIPITLTSPGFGDTLQTNTPTFRWAPVERSAVAAVVFDKPPVFDSDGRVQSENIVWVWHSGLETAIQGNVTFADGVSIVGPDFDDDGPPVPLGTGSHYWAVWAWDSDGIRIDASSNVSYFLVE